MTKEDIITALTDGDAGQKLPSQPLTEDQRKLATLMLAMNATLAQLVLEGALPVNEQTHFMVHLQDFIARLYAAEDITFPGIPTTFRTDSLMGELYIHAFDDASVNGRIPETAKTVAYTQTSHTTEGTANVPAKRTLH